MGFSAGIVGLPNVGKSTLYNLLTGSSVLVSNFPFSTKDENKGIVRVPDERLDFLESIFNVPKVIPNTIEIVDIAGLVKGASKGEGLGNKFLSFIREVDIILEVVRLFSSSEVSHIGEIEPVRDIEIVHTELILKDLETIGRLKEKLGKEARTGERSTKARLEEVEKAEEILDRGELLYNYEFENLKEYRFLTDKKVLIVANVDESNTEKVDSDIFKNLLKFSNDKGFKIVPVAAKLENELSELSEDERKEYMESYGVEKCGVEKLIETAYSELGLITFFTTNNKELRAWTLENGETVLKAAGLIHTDMERGFISSDVIGYELWAEYKSIPDIHKAGKVRREGKNYIVRDGDLILMKFSV